MNDANKILANIVDCVRIGTRKAAISTAAYELKNVLQETHSQALERIARACGYGTYAAMVIQAKADADADGPLFTYRVNVYRETTINDR